MIPYDRSFAETYFREEHQKEGKQFNIGLLHIGMLLFLAVLMML